MSGRDNTRMPDFAELAFAAEWLAQQFLSAPDVAQLERMGTIQGQIVVQRIGEALARPDVAKAICLQLNADSVPAMAVILQRRHTALFEGIFRQRGVSPYASVWDGTGRLYGPAVDRMQVLLRELNVHLRPGCNEPADHIAIELAALAEALRQKQERIVQALLTEMRFWTDRFVTALIAADGDGFYGNAGRLLNALLDRIAQACPAAVTEDIAAAAARI